MISYPFKKIKFVPFLFIYFFIPLNPLIANQFRSYQTIDLMVKRCHEDTKYCKKALFKINYYQKNAAINQKFSCQTRLLGLEANLIMAMNSNLRRNDVKSIINAVKKYC